MVVEKGFSTTYVTRTVIFHFRVLISEGKNIITEAYNINESFFFQMRKGKYSKIISKIEDDNLISGTPSIHHRQLNDGLKRSVCDSGTNRALFGDDLGVVLNRSMRATE